MMTIPTACTVCGSPELIAHAPGDEGDDFAGLFAVSRPVAAQAWCLGCWAGRFSPDRVDFFNSLGGFSG